VETIKAPIHLMGAQTNNLKNIDVTFPADGITAVTGVSGSGKSSLVYGTLYAESQRRFLEGLSSYSRQYSVKAGVPVVREIHGLIPAVRLPKKNPVKNPRSTIATYTGLYDLYRLLFSRLSASKSGNTQPLSTAFSFNSEEGACPVCTGLGSIMLCDQYKLVSDVSKPLIAGALNGSRAGRFYSEPSGQYVAALLTVGEKYGIDFSVAYNELDEKAKEMAMKGCGNEIFDVEWRYKRGVHTGIHKLKSTWPGFLKLVEAEYVRKHADARGDELMEVMTAAKCPHCFGYRLKPEWLEFVLDGMHIGQLTDMTADDALKWFSSDFFCIFEDDLSKNAAAVFQPAIIRYLLALQKAGLGYVSASRTIGTLSGGEFQRLQLAGLVRSPLTGVAYVLDEPSFGLHPKDVRRISELIENLNKHGNSIIMVEHAPMLLKKSEHIIELGPGAGKEGGRLIYEGSGSDSIDVKIVNSQPVFNKNILERAISINNAHANNLRNIDVTIMAGMMTVITGVSGSGKTSLLENVIFSSFSVRKPVFCESFYGFENFSDVVFIGQSGPGKGNHTTIGNKLGISEVIAKIFANCDESEKRGLKTSHFIKGSRDSRCVACDGTGLSQVAMDFFNDVVSPCERCGGTGFKDEILGISIDGQTVFDVLQIPFNELSLFFDSYLPGRSGLVVRNMLSILKKTGIEYLNSCRSLNTMSTGELQRLKLVLGLSSKKGNNTLFLLDEPTGGLHPKDIIKIINLFNEIIMDSNTIVCVTHEPLLVKAAAKYIELGPGGGTQGGFIIGEY
ncbi:MAG TPA: AAA family ATPase, partial [Bacteroidales bacterium]|nr:AAA family ATPase [Bacteroidales bacterium]